MNRLRCLLGLHEWGRARRYECQAGHYRLCRRAGCLAKQERLLSQLAWRRVH